MIYRFLSVFVLSLIALMAVGCCAKHREFTAPPIPNDPKNVQPLTAGTPAPTATLRKPDGQSVELAQLYSQQPTMLIFYRGGWCPYCNRHMSEVAMIEPKLRELGLQVVAISPDRPEKLAESVQKNELGYTLLSDSDMILTQRFGLAFRVDDQTVETYRGYGINLTQASGREHQLLPVPAVYLIDPHGVIRFAHWNADYKQRMSGEVILAAAQQMMDDAR